MSDVIDSEHLGISTIERTKATSFNWIEFHKKHKQYLARIDGIDPKYGFKREFVQSKVGLVQKQPKLRAFQWELKFGYIYEYKNFLVDHITNHVTSGYFISNIHGIIPLEYEQVRVYLKMPVKNRAMVKNITYIEKKEPEGEFAPDDIDF